MNKKIIKRIYNVVIILCFIGAIGWCFSHFYHGSDVVYTDDAQVNRHITPINTRVSGFIKEIRFSDYQHVKKGDTLVIIEDSEFRLHVAQAEAGLRGSKAGSSVVSASMGTTTTNVQTASAGIEEARVDMMNAKQDFDRFAALMKKDAVTRQQYDNAYARYLGAKARYEQASSRKASAALGPQRTDPAAGRFACRRECGRGSAQSGPSEPFLYRNRGYLRRRDGKERYPRGTAGSARTTVGTHRG